MQTFYNKQRTELLKLRESRWSFSLEINEREENGVINRNINNPPNKDDYPKIKSISFLIYEDELKELKKIPDYVVFLPNVEVVSLPIDWLNLIEIPLNTKAIILHNSISLNEIYKWDNKLNNLIYLKIPELIKPFEVNFENVINLEWINIDLKVEKNNQKLAALSKVKNLKHLAFSQAKNFDVFTPFINHCIEGLELFSCKGKSFPIQNIVLLKDLKYIRVNNISIVFDCSWLLELPNLIEIDILNIKEVINIDKILSIKNLKSLSILNCQNPFQKIGKDIFYEKGYEILNIKNA